MSVNLSIPEQYVLPLWRHSAPVTTFYFSVFGLIFLTGLSGNLLVLSVFVRKPGMRMVTSYFISNLALADLFVMIFCLPTTLTNNIFVEWHFGEIFCKFSVWINSSSVCASVYTLVAVAVDRYFAICHAIPYSKFAPKRTLIVIVPIWLLSCSLFTPDLIYYHRIDYIHDEYHPPMVICRPSFPSDIFSLTYFLLVNVTCAFVIPLTIILACYLYIYHTYVQRPSPGGAARRANALRTDSPPKTGIRKIIAEAKRPRRATTRVKADGRAQKMKMKITRMMVLIVICFTSSWLPFYTFFAYVLLLDHGGKQAAFVPILRPFLQWLTLANSCLNPLMYAYFSKTYRRAFSQILSKVYCFSCCWTQDDSDIKSVSSTRTRRRFK